MKNTFAHFSISRIIFALLTALSISLVNLTLAQHSTTSQVVKKSTPTAMLEQQLSLFQTMTANFKQVVITSEGSTLQQSSGQVIIKRPGKLYWKVTKPLSQLIIARVPQAWIYEPDLQQVTLRSLQKQNNFDQTPAILLTNSGRNLLKKFTIKLIKENDEELQFQLIPKNRNELFSSVTLVFVDHKISQIKFVNQLAQQVYIDFSAVEINEPVDDKLFHFVIPKGVDVIDQR